MKIGKIIELVIFWNIISLNDELDTRLLKKLLRL
jgi:hypothetical protein